MAARTPLGSLAVPGGALPVQLPRARRSPRAATSRSALSPSPISGEMSGVVETAADAVEGSKKPALEEEKKPPEEEEKNPGEEAMKEVAPLTSGRLSNSSGPLNGGGSLPDNPLVSPEIDYPQVLIPVDGDKATSECGSAEEEDESKEVQLQKKKEKKRKRVELEQIKKEKQLLVDAVEPAMKASCQLRWHAYFCTMLLRQLHKGSILLDRDVNRVTLFNAEEIVLDHCYIDKEDILYRGLVLDFTHHKARIGKQILQVEGEGELPGSDDDQQGKRNEIKLKRNKKDRRDEKKMNKLKRKRSNEDLERAKEVRRKTMTSPQAKLLGSSIGMFARVASLRRKSESPSVPNVTTHFPSPNLPRVGADFTRSRPRKLKSRIWKDFNPIYENGKEGVHQYNDTAADNMSWFWMGSGAGQWTCQS